MSGETGIEGGAPAQVADGTPAPGGGDVPAQVADGTPAPGGGDVPAAQVADGTPAQGDGDVPAQVPDDGARAHAPLAVKRLHPDAIVPRRAYDGDAGLDLHAVEAVRLAPGARTSVGTGIAVAIPAGQAGLVLPRSGLAARRGIALVNAPGLIDAGYRGEIRVLLLNTDRDEPFEIAVGDRIAQLVLVRLELPAAVELDELPPSERGEGGFGSSGS